MKNNFVLSCFAIFGAISLVTALPPDKCTDKVGSCCDALFSPFETPIDVDRVITLMTACLIPPDVSIDQDLAIVDSALLYGCASLTIEAFIEDGPTEAQQQCKNCYEVGCDV